MHSFLVNWIFVRFFTGLSKSSIRQLQLIQNAAARLLTRARRFDHFSSKITYSHTSEWERFKVLLPVYKALNGLGPIYINDLFKGHKPTRPLRSCHFFYKNKRWRISSTLQSFKSALYTFLFWGFLKLYNLIYHYYLFDQNLAQFNNFLF